MYLLDFEGHLGKINNRFGDKAGREDFNEACIYNISCGPDVDRAEEAHPGSL